MLRLRMTTSKGKVFLGPFVYDLGPIQAKRKLEKMDWLVPKNTEGEPLGEAHLEFTEVDEYPKEAFFDWRMASFDVHVALKRFIKLVEKKWRKLDADNRENTEEMEEGSALNK